MAVDSITTWRKALELFERLQTADDPEAEIEALARTEPQLAHHVRALQRADAAADASVLRTREQAGLPWSDIDEHTPVHRAGEALGPYRLERALGAGGMGEVWLARRSDGLFETPVALKLLHAHLVRSALRGRFVREGRILGQLNHPHIARLLDAGETAERQLYLAIEYIEGEHLTPWCDRQRLGIEARLRLFLQVCAAVAHAHAHLVVHRDLKPSNILVTAAGKAVLLDFGIAKLVETETAEAAETALTRMAGGLLTPEYAAPEQLANEPVTVATDVYALGVVLHELLTGRRPERTAPPGTSPRIMDASGTGDVRAPSRMTQQREAGAAAAARGQTPKRLRALLAGDLDTIVLKALKTPPQARYASVRELADDIVRFLDHRPVLARPDRLGYRLRKYLRRHRLVAGSVLAVSTALVLGLGTSIALYLRAEAARKDAVSVTTFFTQDMLGNVDFAQPTLGELSVRDMLGAASATLQNRFTDRPELAGDIRMALGKAYENLRLNEQRLSEYQQAYRLYARSKGADSREALLALSSQGWTLGWLGRHDEAIEVNRDVVLRARRRFAADDPMVRRAEQLYGASLSNLGEWEAALRIGHDMQAARPELEAGSDEWRQLKFYLAVQLGNLGRFDEAERLYREILASLEQSPLAGYPAHRYRLNFVNLLTEKGELDEALALLESVRAQSQAQFADEDNEFYLWLNDSHAWILYEQGRSTEALAITQDWAARMRERYGGEHPWVMELSPLLSDIHLSLGQADEAAALLRAYADWRQRRGLGEHPYAVYYHSRWAEAQRALMQPAAARAVLDAIPAKALSRLPPAHPYRGALLRIQGLLQADGQDLVGAQAALSAAAAIYRRCYRRGDWRTERVERERRALDGHAAPGQ